MFEPTIIVHGGGGTYLADRWDGLQVGVQASVRQGYTVLTRGGSAVDAVVAAVTAMEDDRNFNAVLVCFRIQMVAFGAIWIFPFKSAPLPHVVSDTVGAVAMDANGNLAASTSTGGIMAKLPGRVGDSPINGSGAYADNTVGAVSSTGRGEFIARVNLARRVGELLEKGETAQQAAEHALEFLSRRVGGAAGVIVLSKGAENGTCQIGHHFITPNMAWAKIKDGKLTYGINPGQETSTSLDI
ncbi:isoaspartyl peptidase/L-asparaginase [Elysia marginata]|uniref:Isoaspartyl peptidase/L-asparaginase n=1 Tax=Elysia marginata TaxID=1093978 RepID=A0AAV4FSQ9_9GAST|nr:isoaspartyl peptidase/L-asparaginase [Elysia marginata]